MATNTALLPAKLAAATAALKAAIQPLTYMGVHVASHVTDEELQSVAVAVVNAIDDVEDQAPPQSA